MCARSSARCRRSRSRCRSSRLGSGAAPGTREAGCKSLKVSRTRLSALSILLRNRKRGIFRSSSSRRINCSCGTFFSSASHTTTAASTAGSRAHVVDEFDRARAVDEGVAVAQEIRGRDRNLDAHLVVTRFGREAHRRRSSRLLPFLSRNRPGPRQDRLKQRGLAALEGAHQCNAPGTLGTGAAVSCHVRLPSAELPRSAVCWFRDNIVSGERATGKWNRTRGKARVGPPVAAMEEGAARRFAARYVGNARIAARFPQCRRRRSARPAPGSTTAVTRPSDRCRRPVRWRRGRPRWWPQRSRPHNCRRARRAGARSTSARPRQAARPVNPTSRPTLVMVPMYCSGGAG